jgi:hypothetical protein
MIGAEERTHLLRKTLDHLENIAKVRAELLQLQNELVEQLDLKGNRRNFSPEQREAADKYLRMIRGEEQ